MVASVAKDFPSAIDGGLHFEMISPQSLKMAYPKDEDSPWKKDFTAGHCHVPALEPYDPEEISTRSLYHQKGPPGGVEGSI